MKKKIPLILHERIEPYLHLKDVLFKVDSKDDCLLHLVDLDEGSDFYLTIKKTENINGTPSIYYSYAPESEYSVQPKNGNIPIDNTQAVLKKWINLLERYKKINTLFDDTILNGFKNEFYAEFEIIEEDANVNPFRTDQILALDAFLEQYQRRLESGDYSEIVDPEDIQEIIDDIQEARDNLTIRSKRWIVDKLSIIQAKLAKHGVPAIKYIIKEGAKQIVQITVKALLEKGTGII